MVSTLVPVQCVCVFICWVISRKLVRLAELLREDCFWLWPLPSLVSFAGYWSWTLAGVGVAWGLVSTCRAEPDCGVACLRDNDSRVGVGLTVVILGVALWGMFRTLGWVLGPPAINVVPA